MPLRDHFRSPVNDTHSWDGLFGGWPAMIVRNLFAILPTGFRSAPQIDLACNFEPVTIGDQLSTTVVTPPPTLTVETDLTDQDEYEVRIYDTERGRQLVATIEIVSPSNKDRPDTRDIFVGKVASLLQQGVCVSLVDLVSNRHANLYAELLARLGRTDPKLASPPPHLYAVTLRTRKPPKRRSRLDAWFFPMTVGQALPTLPVWLTPDLSVVLPLETSYQETCRILGIR